jgi:ceramide glucosyltransferase
LHLLAYIPALFTCTAICFYLANLFALRSWRKQAVPPRADVPVSILKPLKGCDPEMYEAFRSHCVQEYSAPYEIIFGVNDASDEAIPYVERLKAEFPQRDISLVVCSEVLGANRKVSNMAQMAKRAKYAHLLVNDSDITVPADYLSRVMRWFAPTGIAPEVGMVTCLYRARPAKSVWSKFEAIGVIADFMPGALTARVLEGGVHFGLGSTMAVSRSALESFGGFEKLVDYLADDYELANHVVQSGKRVVVPDVVVETHVHDYDFRDFWQHQLRWGRTVRSSRFGGYLGLVVTYGLMWSLLWLLLAPSLLSVTAATVVLALRGSVLEYYANALSDKYASGNSWLVPLRDLITPIVWLCSIGGKKIVWRGDVFRLRAGKLEKL